MTLQEVKNMTTDFITPAIAEKVLQCEPQLIRVQARSNPELLGFPVVVVGRSTKIPRKAFVRFMEGDT